MSEDLRNPLTGETVEETIERWKGKEWPYMMGQATWLRDHTSGFQFFSQVLIQLEQAKKREETEAHGR